MVNGSNIIKALITTFLLVPYPYATVNWGHKTCTENLHSVVWFIASFIARGDLIATNAIFIAEGSAWVIILYDYSFERFILVQDR